MYGDHPDLHVPTPLVPTRRFFDLCPALILGPARVDCYRQGLRQIRAIFADYTPHIEPLSLDEAYLDVTENLKGIASATEIAQQIRERIRAETGLTASERKSTRLNSSH